MRAERDACRGGSASMTLRVAGFAPAAKSSGWDLLETPDRVRHTAAFRSGHERDTTLDRDRSQGKMLTYIIIGQLLDGSSGHAAALLENAKLAGHAPGKR